MNTFPRRVIYLIAFCAILAMGAFYSDTSFLEKASAALTPDPITPSTMTTETVEETVTLSASDIKTWGHYHSWWSGPGAYCSSPFYVGTAPEDIAGSLVAGYKHVFDKGAAVFPCPDGITSAFRGTVWFDLSGITSKGPPLHVFVKSAALHFKEDRHCPGQELLIAQEDWLKGYPDDKLVSGDSYAKLLECVSKECVFDVQPVVNNWVKGEEHGGYPNYGFVFKGPIEEDLEYGNNDVCQTRYSDFSLVVTYKYEKTSIIYVPAPGGPTNPDILTLAPIDLALNKAVTQSSTFTDGEPHRAVDGNTDGVWSKGSVSATSNDSQAWWQVDLGKVRSIKTVKVWNRVEFADRTSDFYVLVSDEPFKSTDLEATKTQVGPGRSFYTSGPCGRPTELGVNQTGRYVRVQLSGTNYLQLAEVEVFAGPK